ncbi:MAG TPA: hemolysin secretion protein D, partial [Rhizobiales bacterium]|nr:hemolysin secretion protein D [Hyphomicrobiales bacterium]
PLRIAFDKDEDTHLLRSGMSAVIEVDTGHSRIPFLSASAKEPAK